jgi:hypothetical protein
MYEQGRGWEACHVTDVTFLCQRVPVDENGRALYAVARSILSALLDQLSLQDLTDLNADRTDAAMRNAHYCRERGRLVGGSVSSSAPSSREKAACAWPA